MLDHWLPPAFWAALVFLASTRHFSAANTSAVFILSLRKLFPRIPPRLLERLHIFTRKLTHWTAYFILTLLIARAAAYQFPESSEYARLAWTFIAVTVFAVGDELHQALEPKRRGSVSDVMIDVFGGLCAILFLWHQR
jgi:VanZ family protein